MTATAVAVPLAVPATAAALSLPYPPGPTPPSAHTGVVGWSPLEERTAGTDWADGVAIAPGEGRTLELQQEVDGRWVTRWTTTMPDDGTYSAAMELTRHWRQAPVTRWRLFAPGTAQVAPAVSGVKVVRTTWEASTDPRDLTVLVTKDRGVTPRDFVPDRLVAPDMAVQGTWVELRPAAADALAELAEAAEGATGKRLVLVSGFRPAGYQERLFERYASRYGAEAASRFSARSGHSEHQTGLAADVTQAGVPFTEFGGTPASDWVADHAWRYGYVVRYPAGGEEITGYRGEPWHLRYVGEDLAAYLHHSGDTLEEAFGVA